MAEGRPVMAREFILPKTRFDAPPKKTFFRPLPDYPSLITRLDSVNLKKKYKYTNASNKINTSLRNNQAKH